MNERNAVVKIYDLKKLREKIDALVRLSTEIKVTMTKENTEVESLIEYSSQLDKINENILVMKRLLPSFESYENQIEKNRKIFEREKNDLMMTIKNLKANLGVKQ